MTAREARYSREEFAQRGQEIYEREVRGSLRPDDEGKFVAIDIESGSYEMDRNDYAATERLLSRRPDAQIWLTQIGQPAAYRLGAVGFRDLGMMTGTVNARHEILIRVPIRNDAGQEQEVEAVLDTGFTGSLTLPPVLIAGLGLTWRSRGNAVLANGNVEQFDIYAATVVWDGIPRQLLIHAIDTAPLLGMALLAGCDLRARVTVGGVVQIEAIP